MRVFSPVRTLLFAALLVASWAATAEAQSEAQARCKAPDAVCKAAERVFSIASFDPTDRWAGSPHRAVSRKKSACWPWKGANPAVSRNRDTFPNRDRRAAGSRNAIYRPHPAS